jgi:hypothetical protein
MEPKNTKQIRALKLYPKQKPGAKGQTRTVPKLILCGAWLERAGFVPGKMAEVTVNYEELIIKPIK